MGAPADRITTANFLTPPELAQWQLAPEGAGRIGGARIELAMRSGQTELARLYQQVPLRVLPPFHLSAGGPALVYLLNPTAGLMDADGQYIEVLARQATRAVLVGQSATRIHPGIHGFATQQWSVRVEDDAVLVVLLGPAIPFQGCRYYQRVAIDLAPTAHLIWGDICTSGRYARGEESEQFQFQTIVQDLTIRREGRLIFRDRFHWEGPWNKNDAHWHFGDSVASGSLFVTGAIEEQPYGVRFLTAAGDSCFRWLGTSEAVISQVVQTALQSAASKCGDSLPWLAGNDLAPCHWWSGVI